MSIWTTQYAPKYVARAIWRFFSRGNSSVPVALNILGATVPYRTVQYGTVQYRTVQYSTVLYDTVEEIRTMNHSP